MCHAFLEMAFDFDQYFNNFMILIVFEIQISPCSSFKLEKFVSSPPGKAAESSLKFLKGINMEKRNLEQDMILYGSNEKANDKSNTNFRSPFKTPPSRHEKVFYLFCLDCSPFLTVLSID